MRYNKTMITNADIDRIIHPDLQMRRIKNAEDRCKKANTDWGKNFWYNTFKALCEWNRVLKPGGWGVFQIPQDLNRSITFEDDSITDKKERARVFGQYDHVRVYGRDYFDKLRAVGFKVDEVDYTAQLSNEDVNKYRLSSGEIIPFVRK